MNHASLGCMYYDETGADIEVTELETKSILKPPKVRAPLQEVDFQGIETDPDVIRKRRVSFAGVKIKEFNSKAESLIICSTPAYEETFSTSSDSSALTTSGIDNTSSAECLIDCTIMNDTMDLTDLSCKVDGDNSMDITSLPKTGSPTKDSNKESASIIPTNVIQERELPGIKLFDGKPNDPVAHLPPTLGPVKLLVKDLLESSSIVEDTSLIQECIPQSDPLAKDISPVYLLNGKNIGNNLFMPQSESETKKTLKSDSLSNNQHIIPFSTPIVTNVLNTSLANQSGMEFTAAIPQNCPELKVTDSLSQMDFTEAIPSKVAQERLGQVQPSNVNCEENVSHSGMDFTEGIPKFNEEHKFHFNVKNTNITQRGQAVNVKPGPATTLDAPLSMDFTGVRKPRKSCFIEEPNKENVRPMSDSYYESNSEVESSVMEFTEAVIFPKSNNVWNHNNHNKNPVASLMNSFIGLSHEKQQDFHTSQMEFTAGIPSRFRNELLFQNSLVNNSFNMEITEAIPPHLRAEKFVGNVDTFEQISKENEEAVILNKENCLMELTTGVGSKDNNRASNDKIHTGENAQAIIEQCKSFPKATNGFWPQTLEQTSEKDVESVGNNTTMMEFTEAIPKCLIANNDNVGLWNKNTKEDAKSLVNLHPSKENAPLASNGNNKVAGHEHGMFSDVSCMLKQNIPDLKIGNGFIQQTGVYEVCGGENICNNSTLMEFTEAISKYQNVPKENIGLCNKNSNEDAKPVVNFQSTMELTAAVDSKESNKSPIHINALVLQAPTIFENKPSGSECGSPFQAPNLFEQIKPVSNTDKGLVQHTAFHGITEDESVVNKSTQMEFTEFIPKCLNVKNDTENNKLCSRNTNDDAISTVNVQSAMEFTAPLISKGTKPANTLDPFDLNTLNIFGQNKELQAEFDILQQPIRSPASLKTDDNNSTIMDFTEAIPQTIPFSRKLEQNGFKINQTSSQMEFTEGIPAPAPEKYLHGEFTSKYFPPIISETIESSLNAPSVCETIDNDDNDIFRLPPEIDRTQKYEQQKCTNVFEYPIKRDFVSEYPVSKYEVDFTDMLPLSRETNMPNLQKKLIFSGPEKGDLCNSSQMDAVERVSSNKPAPSGWMNAAEEIELESSIEKEATPKPKKLPRFSTANFISRNGNLMDETELEQSVKCKTLFPQTVPQEKSHMGTPPIDNSLRCDYNENQSDLYIIEQTCQSIYIDPGQVKQIDSAESGFGENQRDDLSQVESNTIFSSQKDNVMPYNNVVEKNSEPNIESNEVPCIEMIRLPEKCELEIPNQGDKQSISPELISMKKQESEIEFKKPEDIISRSIGYFSNKINLSHQSHHSKEDLKKIKEAYHKEQWENLMKNRSFFNEINFFSMGPYCWKYSFPWPLEIAVRIKKEVITFKSENIIGIELRSTLHKIDILGSLIDFCMKKNLNLILSEEWLNSHCKNMQSLTIAIKIIEDEYESLRPFFSDLSNISLKTPWTFKDNCIFFNLVSLRKRYHVRLKINISNVKSISGNDVEVFNFVNEIRQEEVRKIFDKYESSKERFHNFIEEVETCLAAS